MPLPAWRCRLRSGSSRKRRERRGSVHRAIRRSRPGHAGDGAARSNGASPEPRATRIANLGARDSSAQRLAANVVRCTGLRRVCFRVATRRPARHWRCRGLRARHRAALAAESSLPAGGRHTQRRCLASRRSPARTERCTARDPWRCESCEFACRATPRSTG
jgi:hypothetical protein